MSSVAISSSDGLGDTRTSISSIETILTFNTSSDFLFKLSKWVQINSSSNCWTVSNINLGHTNSLLVRSNYFNTEHIIFGTLITIKRSGVFFTVVNYFRTDKVIGINWVARNANQTSSIKCVIKSTELNVSLGARWGILIVHLKIPSRKLSGTRKCSDIKNLIKIVGVKNPIICIKVSGCIMKCMITHLCCNLKRTVTY